MASSARWMLCSPLALLVLVVLVRSGLPVLTVPVPVSVPLLPVLVPVLVLFAVLVLFVLFVLADVVLADVVLAVLAVLVLVDWSLPAEAVCAAHGSRPTRASSSSVATASIAKHAARPAGEEFDG